MVLESSTSYINCILFKHVFTDLILGSLDICLLLAKK